MSVSDNNTVTIICSVLSWFNVMNIFVFMPKNVHATGSPFSEQATVQVLDVFVCVLVPCPQNILYHKYFNLEQPVSSS